MAKKKPSRRKWRHGFIIISPKGEFDLTPMGNVIVYRHRSAAVMGTRAGWSEVVEASLYIRAPSTSTTKP